MARAGADLDARHDPPAAQVHDHELAARAVADEGVAAVGGDRRVARRAEPAQHAPHARGAHGQQRHAPAAGWATTTCPPGPLSMLRGSSTVASRRCTSPAGEPDDDDVRLGVRRRQRQRLAAGGRPPPGERRQRGQAEADEGAAVELHACHYGAAARGRSAAAQAGSEHEHAGVVAQRAVVGRGDGVEHGRRRRGGRRRAQPSRARRSPSSPKGSPPGAVRSSTPSETRTTSSSGRSSRGRARAAGRGGRARGPGRRRRRARAARARRARQRRRVPAAQPRQRRGRAVPAASTALMKISGTSSAQIASWMWAAASARSPPPRRVAR